jgi:hypothetical protein
MGESKRRAKEIERLKESNETWRSTLSKKEKVILELAERLDQRVVRGS